MRRETIHPPRIHRQSAGADGVVRYLSAKEVAERYGRTVGWVHRCLKLPRRKMGKYLVFREDELEDFEQYRKGQGRGFFIRPDSEATKLQKARKRLKFDIVEGS